MTEADWRRANRANWDERVAVHMGPRGYDLAPLRAGHGKLNALEEAELPPVAGLRIVHLQCHFGADSLTLAQRGAAVVGLDFSPAGIAAARRLAAELGLGGRARFVEADLYDAPAAVPQPHGFDLAYVTWGALTWLPDIAGWARIVAGLLSPGGTLYLAEGHPAAWVFDDSRRLPDGRPGFFAPYFSDGPLALDDPRDYADPEARLAEARTYNWNHGLGAVVTALIEAGMRLDWLREHPFVAWPMFDSLVQGSDGLYRWPDRPWLPLSYSLSATRAG